MNKDDRQFENYLKNQHIFTVGTQIRESTDEFILEYLENSKIVQESRLSKDDLKRAIWLLTEERAGRVVHNPEPLTDNEQRIFLWAMHREEKVCKETDARFGGDDDCVCLVDLCKSIARKVKACLFGESHCEVVRIERRGSDAEL